MLAAPKPSGREIKHGDDDRNHHECDNRETTVDEPPSLMLQARVLLEHFDIVVHGLLRVRHRLAGAYPLRNPVEVGSREEVISHNHRAGFGLVVGWREAALGARIQCPVFDGTAFDADSNGHRISKRLKPATKSFYDTASLRSQKVSQHKSVYQKETTWPCEQTSQKVRHRIGSGLKRFMSVSLLLMHV